MNRRHLRVVGAMVATLLVFVEGGLLRAQALPAATRPGGFIAAGANFSGYQSPYNKDEVAGGSFYVDANLTRRLGLEGEARFLRLNTQSDTRASTYLIGPRVSTTWPRFRPYVKGLIGVGKFTFPYNYAQGSYLVIAPGAGLDVSILHGRAFLRVVDFEYQDWHSFTFGRTRPYGFSSGVSVRVF